MRSVGPMTPTMAPKERRARIRALLLTGSIGTQEELREALLSDRVDVTQATVSRDLRALRALRVTRPDGSIGYDVPGTVGDEPPATPSERVAQMVELVTSNEALIIVRTAPGAAGAVARAIDLSRIEGVLGSIAGDDTIFVSPASTEQIKQVERRIFDLFKLSVQLSGGAQGLMKKERS